MLLTKKVVTYATLIQFDVIFRSFRVLGFRRVPPSVARRIHIVKELEEKTQDDELKEEFIVSPGEEKK